MGRRGARRAALLALALLLAALALGALAAAARAETGAPALEGDGVWRARGDWALANGDRIDHQGERIEVFGNLTVGLNASLTIGNSTLTFPNGTAPAHTLSIAADASLSLENATISAEGENDTLSIDHGHFTAVGCRLLLSLAPLAPSAITVQSGAVALKNCTVSTGAAFAVDARDSGFSATETDFVGQGAAAADLFIGGSGSYTLDTATWGALHTEGAPAVTAFASARFAVESASGAEIAAHVNGTGAFGELIALDTTPGATPPVRLKWLDYVQAPALVTAEERRSPQPVRFTAFAAGVGGNTSQVFLTAARQNITVVLERTYDVAITSFTVIGKGLSGPPLKRAYYVEANVSIDLFVHVDNKGVAPSPPENLAVTQYSLEPSSWARQSSREVHTVDVRALSPGEGINISFSLVMSDFGGKLDQSGPCFTSISYTSALRAALLDNLSGDFAPWNDEREFTLVAFDVHGSSAPECQSKGADFLPWLAAGAGAAIAAVGFITYRYSDEQSAKRAALKAKDEAPNGAGPDQKTK